MITRVETGHTPPVAERTLTVGREAMVVLILRNGGGLEVRAGKMDRI
jgi:hypothetical protein